MYPFFLLSESPKNYSRQKENSADSLLPLPLHVVGVAGLLPKKQEKQLAKKAENPEISPESVVPPLARINLSAH